MSNRETKRIRAAVMERARSCCENCARFIGHDGEDGHMDHQLGRKHQTQAVDTCWALCPQCHHLKTISDPNAEFWLLRMLIHCRRCGLFEQAEQVMKQLEWKRAKEAVSNG